MITIMDFDPLINQFQDFLNNGQKNNYLPILKNTFIPFIVERHQTLTSIDVLFAHEITRRDIINAGILYVDSTPKVTSTSAVKKYLSAVGEFFRKVVLPIYPHSILSSISNYHELFADIVEECEKSLKAVETNMCLTPGEYSVLLKYLSTWDTKLYKQKQVKVIIELILLYGFRLDVVASIRPSDLISEQHKLRVIVSEVENNLLLDVPYAIYCDLQIIKDALPPSAAFMFQAENGNLISASYLNDDFKRIGKQLKIRITTTRLSKYACVQMLLQGVNSEIVGQLTGLKLTQLKECQQFAANILKDNTSRFLNSRLRNILTYDDLDKAP